MMQADDATCWDQMYPCCIVPQADQNSTDISVQSTGMEMSAKYMHNHMHSASKHSTEDSRAFC